MQLSLQTFTTGNASTTLYVPDPFALQQTHQQTDALPFPFWAQVWPAALSLSTFIDQHPAYIANKQVLELAAGLGLPSFVAAKHAKQVICSDYIPEAVDIVTKSIAYNQLSNMQSEVLDWNYLPDNLITDVVLMSDVNYNPAQFDVLYELFTTFINNGVTILLSTPQRLMAKPFIEKILPWCIEQQSIEVMHFGQPVFTSILVLYS